MGTLRISSIFLIFYVLLFMDAATAQMPGFLSLDCGGDGNFTDDLGLVWNPDYQMISGQAANISVLDENRRQYKTVRYFPADNRKYCYILSVVTRTRYLLRATFLYGDFDNNHVYPKFDISFGPTPWATIVISDANTKEVHELIFLAADPTISICLSNATTGHPFISTLELRQFNGSIYFNQYENQFFLSVAARINFGADSVMPVRYPDDPFDRLWESDSVKKPNYLVDVAPGTEKISTRMPIDVTTDERPPQKVMQTAVVGRNGTLTYRMNLDGFPGFGWAFSYFAEIEDLTPNDSRKFRFVLPGDPEFSTPIVNIQENARGKYRLYEPGYFNISFPFVLSFGFAKTSDSTMGPLLNAMEISKYLEKSDGSPDGPNFAGLSTAYPSAEWAKEGGDPCLPVPWSWVHCNSSPQPKVVSIKLSGKNLTGNIPLEFTKLSSLVELWLDKNSLVGSIPDFSGCPNLRTMHLEDNQLTGELPSSLTLLPNLRALYIQNNRLSGEVPYDLLNKDIILNYTGNPNLQRGHEENPKRKIVTGLLVGAAFVLLIAAIIYWILRIRGKKNSRKKAQKPTLITGDAAADAYHFTISEIQDATNNFERQVGFGGFGVVYYGRLKDGKEIAVKVLINDSFHVKREFSNEVALLSRIHHRNLLQFLGYCQEDGKSILVYEFMHNGTLKEHLYGPLTHGRGLSWTKRLEIAEEAGRGIEYLHIGCVPSVIHRDLKTSNILLDRNMRAKVSDFGLSKLAVDGTSHVSSMVRGTVGYLDPDYYISQQLTDKSDVYSFGVILLELISGQEAISNNFGDNCRNIAQWARLHIQRGDVKGIIDPALHEFNMPSMWKIAELALLCVEPHGSMRPSISEVVKDIQNAVSIAKEAETAGEGISGDLPRLSSHSSNMRGSPRSGITERYLSIDESNTQPTAR